MISKSTEANTNNLTHLKYRKDIDGLRAIAVLAVITYHAFPDIVCGGFIGVDIFFVISGFLISGIIFKSIEHHKFSFIEFYMRRVLRIFPALLILLISSFALGWFVLLADEYKQLGKHIAGGAGFVLNFILWKENGYFDNLAEVKPLLHLWSLSIEEQFYIFWPIILWLGRKSRVSLLGITLVLALISFALNIRETQRDIIAMFYSPQPRFWEILIGAILAYLMLYKQNNFASLQQKFYNTKIGHLFYSFKFLNKKNVLKSTLSLLGLLLITVGLLLVTKDKIFPGWWALLPTIGAVLIISAGDQAWLNRTLLSSRLMVWFGLISFPLYL